MVLREVDALLVNDTEARMLAGEPNLVKAARVILGWGPRVVVVKRGEYGALMVTPERFFFVPAYPLESVFDPTGAGDTFAGGFMGVLARRGGDGRGGAPACHRVRERDRVVHRRGLLAGPAASA